MNMSDLDITPSSESQDEQIKQLNESLWKLEEEKEPVWPEEGSEEAPALESIQVIISWLQRALQLNDQLLTVLRQAATDHFPVARSRSHQPITLEYVMANYRRGAIPALEKRIAELRETLGQMEALKTSHPSLVSQTMGEVHSAVGERVDS